MAVDEHKDWKMDKKSVELEFARNSLREELEAINNYGARVAETEDPELKRVLIHNMDEEKEHVAMLVEWIRKNDATQDKVFKEHD
jgi:hypothetical protein